MPTIDATKGGAAANSYATVEEADTFLDGQYGASEWSDVDPENKARLLITASRMIDKWSVLYDSAAATQALNFPLSIDDGSSKADGFDKAKRACIYQAIYLYRNYDVIAEAQTMGIQATRSEQIGPTSKSILGFNPFKQYAPEVYALLYPWLDMKFRLNKG